MIFGNGSNIKVCWKFIPNIDLPMGVKSGVVPFIKKISIGDNNEIVICLVEEGGPLQKCT